MGFEPGRLAVRRHFMRGEEISRVNVGRVVADDERGLWLWFATGSAFHNIGAADGRAFREVPFADWGRTEHLLHVLHWHGDVLMLHPPGAPYSVWFFFTGPAGAFGGWYVNLERPAARWQGPGDLVGVDTVDYDLDIVAEPDRSWRWKDEDEFTAHLAFPDIYWCADEAAVRASGWEAVKLIEAGEFPFDGTAVDFQPDPQWTVPATAPVGWDRPRAW
jgi:hypothetical protein